MPVQPLRVEIKIDIQQELILGQLKVGIESGINGEHWSLSGAAIAPDQLFTRLEELISNHLRSLCNEMAKQLKQQKDK